MRVTAEERDRRKDHVLAVATKMFEVGGLDLVTQNQVANQANVAHGCIQNYFGTINGLRAAAVRHASETKNGAVLVQAACHPDYGKLLTDYDRHLAIQHLKG